MSVGRSAAAIKKAIPYSPLFRVTFQTKYNPDLLRTPWLHPATNPIGYKIWEERTGKREKKGLWWMTAEAYSISKKSTIRNWCRRRLREAFRRALELHGINKDGFLLEKDKQPTQPGWKAKVAPIELRGTLLLLCSKEIMVASGDQVLGECKQLVYNLIKLQMSLNDDKSQSVTGIEKEGGGNVNRHIKQSNLRIQENKGPNEGKKSGKGP